MDTYKLARRFASEFLFRLPSLARYRDDLTQEAAVGILRGLKKLDKNKGAELPYLRMWAWALMRRFTETVRPVSTRTAITLAVSIASPGAEPEPGEHFDDRTVSGHQFEAVYAAQALRALTPPQRAIVRARAHGERYEEIAATHGMSRETARKAHQRVQAAARAVGVGS